MFINSKLNDILKYYISYIMIMLNFPTPYKQSKLENEAY